MGKFIKKQSGKQSSAPAAVELFPHGVPSAAHQGGRRLVLKFKGTQQPALDRIEFKASRTSKSEFRQRGFFDDKTRSFKNAPVAKVLPVFFLDYLCACLESPPRAFHMEGGNGTLAATLGYALDDRDGSWYRLFVEYLTDGGKTYLVEAIFKGGNWPGRQPEPRMIEVNSEELPADCIEVFWNEEKLTGLVQIQKLADQFRKAWELPPPTRLELPKGEGSPPEGTPRQQELLKEAQGAKPPEIPPPPDQPPPEGSFKFSALFSKIGHALDALQGKPRATPRPKTPKPKPDRPKQQAIPQAAPDPATQEPRQESAPKLDKRTENSGGGNESKPAEQSKAPQPVELPPLPRIDPIHFRLPETEGRWPDEAPLIELPTEEETYQWTIKNAFEGVLIMGRTGGGKSSGAGATIAEAFIRARFGGLVLTVKKNEAQHWERLCAHCGRADELIVVRPGDKWRLNVLAYESQRPGRGSGLAANLTSFCRNLLRISSRNQGSSSSEQIWETAGDQLLDATFDIFLLAGDGVTFDHLSQFISAAPAKDIPQTEEGWLKVPVFGAILLRAKNSIKSPEDQRIFDKARDYWCKIYPPLASKTRTSITLGIYAMLDAFRARDIPDLISAETTITPEAIMNGLIVVIDLPLKEYGRSGLMVQSAWKYLFETALERHDHARGPKRRPVFLWEDEAQYFFSDHDHHFQDTARSSRVSRVVLTQNLHSFYKELGRDGVETANSVFGNLNTKVFHNNSDPQTNEWAAKHFGMELQTRYSFSHAPPPPAKDFFDGLRQSIDPPNRTTVSSGQHWEHAVRPEEFNTLRTGGPENDFLVDAWITWMGLSAENDRHFTKITFAQNQNL